MKATRRAIDAAVVAIMLGPLRRWLMDRLRTALKDDVRARFAPPAQAARRAGAIPDQLVAVTSSLPDQLATLRARSLPDQLATLRASAVATSPGDRALRHRRDIVMTALIAGAVAAVATASAFALAALVRSRRRGSVGPSSRRVAVPVVVPDGEHEDELRSIRGIGSVSAERLHAIGITTVAQVAAWRPEDIERIAEQIESSPERIAREDWVGQARAISGVESATDLA